MYNFSIIIGNSLIQMYPTFSGAFGDKMRFSLSIFSVRFLCDFFVVYGFQKFMDKSRRC